MLRNGFANARIPGNTTRSHTNRFFGPSDFTNYEGVPRLIKFNTVSDQASQRSSITVSVEFTD